MLYVTGDTHGDWGRMSKLLIKLSSDEHENTLLIAGDFGFLFQDNEEEQRQLDAMEQSGVTICFCDGNHENFDALNALPVSNWNGGRVHFLRPHVIHLMRGEQFLIEGKRFFVMGGAASVDKQYRLLLEYHGGEKSWWKEELPNNEEYKRASAALAQLGGEVDYVLTHTAPTEIIRLMGYPPNQDDIELTGFLEWVMYELKYKQWYFGHFHEDREVAYRCTCLLNNIVQLD